MVRGFSGLIAHLLEQVALTGEKGADILSFKSLVESYYNAPPTTAEKVLGVPDKPNAADYGVDRRLLEKVWEWLTAEDDISIGKERQGNTLSLSEAEVEAEAQSLSSQAIDETAQTAPESSAVSASKDPLRIFTTADRIWQALTGHGEDWTRLTPTEFQLLTIIAGYREEGIDQRSLIHISKQDKRSVPQRTDRLHDKGYILKHPIVVNKFRTSRCILIRFAPAEIPGEDDGEMFTDGRLRRPRFWDRVIVEMLDVRSPIMLSEIQEQLGIDTHDKRESLWIALHDLSRIEVISLIQGTVGGDGNSAQTQGIESIERKKMPQLFLKEMFLRSEIKKKRSPQGDESGVGDDGSVKNQVGSEAVVSNPSTISLQNATETHADKFNTNVQAPSEAGTVSQNTIAFDSPKSKALVLYKPPLWTPFMAPANLIFEIVDRAGKDGMSSVEIQRRCYGMFWARNLENILSKLTDQWQLTQPSHLKHLTIIRDTSVSGSYYVYRTMRGFQEAVDAGMAMWEAVQTSDSRIPARSKTALEKARNAKLEYDEWGFPKPEKSAFPLEGYATVADVVKHAKMQPTKRLRGILTAADSSVTIDRPYSGRVKGGAMFDTSDLVEYGRLWRMKQREDQRNAEFLVRARRHATWLAVKELVETLGLNSERDVDIDGLDVDMDDDAADVPATPEKKRGRPKKIIKKRKKSRTSVKANNVSQQNEQSAEGKGQAPSTDQPETPISTSEQRFVSSEVAIGARDPQEAQKAVSDPQIPTTKEVVKPSRERIDALLAEYLAINKPGAWYDVSRTRRQLVNRYKKDGVLLIKSEKLKELDWFRNNPGTKDITPAEVIQHAASLVGTSSLQQQRPSDESLPAIHEQIEPAEQEDESSDVAMVDLGDQIEREVLSAPKKPELREGIPDVERQEMSHSEVAEALDAVDTTTTTSRNDPQDSVSTGSQLDPTSLEKSERVSARKAPVASEPIKDIKHCRRVQKKGRPRANALPTLVLVIHSEQLKDPDLFKEACSTCSSESEVESLVADVRNRSKSPDGAIELAEGAILPDVDTDYVLTTSDVSDEDFAVRQSSALLKRKAKNSQRGARKRPRRDSGPQAATSDSATHSSRSLSTSGHSTNLISALIRNGTGRNNQSSEEDLVSTSLMQQPTSSVAATSSLTNDGSTAQSMNDHSIGDELESSTSIQLALKRKRNDTVESSPKRRRVTPPPTLSIPTPASSTPYNLNTTPQNFRHLTTAGMVDKDFSISLDDVESTNEDTAELTPNVATQNQLDNGNHLAITTNTEGLSTRVNSNAPVASNPSDLDSEMDSVDVGSIIQTAVDTSHEARSESDKLEGPRSSTSSKPSRTKNIQRAGVQRGGGSVAMLRSKLLFEIIERCGGVVPGNREITDPFRKAWEQKFKPGQSIDRETIQKVVNNLLAQAKLRKFTFAFKAVDGTMQIKQILALPHLTPDSPQVLELQKQIAAAPRDAFVPPEAYLPGTVPRLSKSSAVSLGMAKHKLQDGSSARARGAGARTSTGLSNHGNSPRKPRSSNRPVGNSKLSSSGGSRLLTLPRARAAASPDDGEESESPQDAETSQASEDSGMLSRRTGEIRARRTVLTADARDPRRRTTNHDLVNRAMQRPLAPKKVAFDLSSQRGPGSMAVLNGRISKKSLSKSLLMNRSRMNSIAAGMRQVAPGYEMSQITQFVPPLGKYYITQDRPVTKLYGPEGLRKRLADPCQLFWPLQGVFGTNFAMTTNQRVWYYNGTLAPSRRVAMFNVQRQKIRNLNMTYRHRNGERADLLEMKKAPALFGSNPISSKSSLEPMDVDGYYAFTSGQKHGQLQEAERFRLALSRPSQVWHASSATFGTLFEAQLQVADEASHLKSMLPTRSTNKALAKKRPIRPEGPDSDVIDFTDLSSPKKKLQVPRGTRKITAASTQKLIIACIAVQVLTGGVDGHINWHMVTRIFQGDPSFDVHIYRQKWASYSKVYSGFVEDITVIFQNKFLEAYENGEVPIIDYDRLGRYDWKSLMRWALREIPLALALKNELPATREELDRTFVIKQGEAVYKTAVLRPYRHVVSQSTLVRSHHFSEIPDGLLAKTSKSTMSQLFAPEDVKSVNEFAFDKSQNPAASPHFFAAYPEHGLALAKSLIRANILTPESTYDSEVAHRRLKQIPGPVLREAMNTLMRDKVISNITRKKTAHSRGYKLNDVFLTHIYRERFVPVAQFEEAVAYKRQLDAAFRSGNNVTFTLDSKNGHVMAAQNLIDHGRIELVAILPPIKNTLGAKHPKLSKWGFNEGDYATKRSPIDHYRFELEMRPTDSWVDGNPLGRVEPVLVDINDDLAPIPMWQDINGELIPGAWRMMVCLTIQLFIVRPYLSINDIAASFDKGKAFAWEIQLVVDALETAGALQSRDELGMDREVLGKRWALTEWWWLCCADTPGDGTSMWETVTVR